MRAAPAERRASRLENMTVHRAACRLALAALVVASAHVAAADPASGSGIEVRAQLIARRTTVLSSEIAGKIDSLPVREGESFVAGQEIAGIDCATYKARMLLADAKFNGASRKLEAIQLLDKRRAVSPIDLDLAAIEVDAARAEQQLAAKDVGRCRIVAPFVGRVAELKVQRYQFVEAGQPVIDVLSDRELEIEMLAPSRSLAWMKPGMAFSVRIDELDRDYPAVIARIVPRIDPVSQTVKIYSRIDGDFPELLPGMSGLGRLTPPVGP